MVLNPTEKAKLRPATAFLLSPHPWLCARTSSSIKWEG